MAFKKVKIKLSEESVEELLDLGEKLGLEKKDTREQRRKLYSQERECLFG